MEPEQVTACARNLYAHGDAMRQQLLGLLAAARSVEWYGSNRDYFEAELEQLVQQWLVSIETAQHLAAVMEREVEQWQSIDWAYAQQFASFTLPEFYKP